MIACCTMSNNNGVVVVAILTHVHMFVEWGNLGNYQKTYLIMAQCHFNSCTRSHTNLIMICTHLLDGDGAYYIMLLTFSFFSSRFMVLAHHALHG
jgi:hypothetical protein